MEQRGCQDASNAKSARCPRLPPGRRGDRQSRWDMAAPSARSAPDLILVDESVEGLSVDACALRGGRDVAGMALEQAAQVGGLEHLHPLLLRVLERHVRSGRQDRKSTRLNSSHLGISYAVFCFKKK